ncbi:MFS transporter [Bacillus cereus]|uniref:MFS transporter n=1 Tax=Bacillus cereus group TaxID=86661 RepID=UPI000BED060A|nr:MFS transporter [Bacillus thuringiensis]MCU5129275.1 MFS transporter [Bacillus cereus]MCU5525558.1 MFS transporter [Bacillus cereus]MCU5543187.1 MFS transporter [Bacillus cereus]PEE99590.1 MFS transporter [Bacillus thuringiensis]PGX91317.1 MFS transporter [Bacillus thuringiensis]
MKKDFAENDTKTLLVSRNALFLLFALPGVAFATWISRTAATRDILAVSNAEMGWILFGLSVGSIIGLLSASHFIDGKGARDVIIGSMFFMIVGLLCLGSTIYFVSSMGAFGSLLVFGLAEVALNVEGSAIEQKLGTTLLPKFHGFFSIGTLVGALSGSAAISLHIPILYQFLAISVMFVLLVCMLYRFLPHGTGKKEKSRNKKRAKHTSLRMEKKVLLLGLFVLGMAFAEGSANDWLPIVMVDGHEQSVVTGSIMYTIFVLAMTLARMCSSYFLDRFGRVAVMRATIMMAIIGMTIVIFGSNSYFLALGVVLWGIGAALGFPIGLSAAGGDSENATSNVAAVSIIGFTAFLVGPPFLGILGEAFGIRNALLAVLLFVILSGIVSSVMRENASS